MAICLFSWIDDLRASTPKDRFVRGDRVTIVDYSRIGTGQIFNIHVLPDFDLWVSRYGERKRILNCDARVSNFRVPCVQTRIVILVAIRSLLQVLGVARACYRAVVPFSSSFVRGEYTIRQMVFICIDMQVAYTRCFL